MKVTMGIKIMAKKKVFEIVSEAYDKIVTLKPTNEEIAAFAHSLEEVNATYGVVTYSISQRKSDPTFLRLHDTRQTKFGGHIHIDIGYIDEESKKRNDNAYYRNIMDTTHLMLGRNHSVEFIEFIEKVRLTLK